MFRFLGAVTCFVAVVVEAVSTGPCIPPTPVNVRFPTLLGKCPASPSDCNTGWQAAPDGWLFGTWHFAWSPQAAAQSLYNFHIDYYPILPTSANDTVPRMTALQSYQFGPNSSAILTAYAVDFALPRLGAAFFNSTVPYLGDPAVEYTPYEWMAWGYDSEGDGYIVYYDGPSGGVAALLPDISFLSRVVGGPSQDTRDEVIQQLKAFGDQNLTAVVDLVTKTPTNGRRRGLGPVFCDPACQNNAGLQY